MPIRLTSKEYRIIALALAVSSASLLVSLKYFWRAFPEASIDLRVNRNDSEPIAAKFLEDRGIRSAAFHHAAIFDYNDEVKVYLERTQGVERLAELTRGPVRLWRWSHRWFKPQQKEELRVDVTTTGDVAGFSHELPEAAPGAVLEAPKAREIAEKFLREAMKRNLADVDFVEGETEKRPARADHTFTWKQKSVALGDGSLRLQVEVAGDQVAGYSEFVKIPEQWSRDYEKLRSRNEVAQIVATVFFILLSLAMVVILVRRLRDGDVPLRLAAGFGVTAAALYILGELNTFSVTEFFYHTTDPYSSFVTGFAFKTLAAGAGTGFGIFLLVAASEPVYRESFPNFISLRRYFSWQGLRSRSFFLANVIGFALTFFFFAYQTVFYLTANKLGAWAPVDIPISNELNTRFPWVAAVFIGFLAAVSEEMQFRAFAIPFLKKIFRSLPLALILAAFNWSFLHSAYPNQPFFIRGVEVGLAGIITGLIMLRFGVLATLVWHYSVDALYTVLLLLRSSNHYLMVSGAVSAGILFVPLAVALVAYLRSGTFADETPLTNASAGVRRAPAKEVRVEAEPPLTYIPLSRSRLALAGGVMVLGAALTALPAYRFGKGLEPRSTRSDAVRLSDEYLTGRQINPSSYRRVAWLHENLDPLAVRYLLERRSVEETDRLYRQATKILLWEVRYFRPNEKEEHLVFIDAVEKKVFGYRHVLDENASGASLSPDVARALAEKAVQEHGYSLAQLELQDSRGEKRKARQDYTLVWQAKAGDARNVGDAHYRLEVDIAGDKVIGFSRYFKLPEEWVRQRNAVPLSNTVLNAVRYLFVGLLAGGAIFLFVQQVRNGKIPWKRGAKLGVLVAAATLITELNVLPTVYRQYDTSLPLASFWVTHAVGYFIVPLGAGLLGWVATGLALSLYPDAWRIFRGSARHSWRRDAALAMLTSLAASMGLSRLGAFAAAKLHAMVPVDIAITPGFLDSYSPGAGYMLQNVKSIVFLTSLAGLAVFAAKQGLAKRPWWFWVGGAMLLVSLGPQAHSPAEFAFGWVTNLVGLLAGVSFVAFFCRDNVLAFVASQLLLFVAKPAAELLSQPLWFCRWNGMLLVALAAGIMAWLLMPGKGSKLGVQGTTGSTGSHETT